MKVKKIFFFSGAFLILGALFAYFLFKELYVALGLVVGGVILIIFSFFKRKEKSNLTINTFINVFTHFRVALDSDANVYQALTATLAITKGEMYLKLEGLIQTINSDHTVKPFISFATPFKNRFITHIMINVYMLINHGLEIKRLWQFNYIFETLTKEFSASVIEVHRGSLERFDMLLYLGTGIMMFTLMTSVLALIGTVLWVISWGSYCPLF